MNLNKEIFTKSKIVYAIDIYRDYANIKMTEESGYWILDFKNCRYGRERTEREFENYLIGLEN